MPTFEQLRDVAWKKLLGVSFKAFPKKVDEILKREGWEHFTDFMAAVSRSGKVMFQFQKPHGVRAQTIEKKGTDLAIEEAYAASSTVAMLTLLSGAFYGVQEGEPDPGLAAHALGSENIASWRDLSRSVFALAHQLFMHVNEGKSLLDFAKPETLLLYGLEQNDTPEVMAKLVDTFGLKTPEHLVGLLQAFYAAELTTDDLDKAIGQPEVLTEIMERAPSNTQKQPLVYGKLPRAPEMGYAGLTI